MTQDDRPLRRVAVRVVSERVEEARARMLELSPAGFEEQDDGASVELAAYVDAAGERRIRTVFGEVRAEDVEPGWEERWRAFHRPVRVGGVWIGPPWEDPPAGERVVVIDPGRAFGTGRHPTTRLCLELLGRVERGSLLDVGCGSGVLAIAAAKLGFGPLVAVDVDPVAVVAARENVAVNGVDVDVRELDAVVDELPRANVAVANIALVAVEQLLAVLDACYAVTSGYLSHDEPSAPGWERTGREELAGWAADLFRRPTV